MRKDRFNVGDVLVKKEKGQEPIHRKITAVRDSGYSWIYVDDEREIEFYSEDSSDPFFEWKWELVDMSENKIGKEDLYSGYYLTNDERLGSFHGYKTEDEKIIVGLVDILDGEKFFVDADEIRRLNHDEVLYFANKMRSEIKVNEDALCQVTELMDKSDLLYVDIATGMDSEYIETKLSEIEQHIRAMRKNITKTYNNENESKDTVYIAQYEFFDPLENYEESSGIYIYKSYEDAEKSLFEEGYIKSDSTRVFDKYHVDEFGEVSPQWVSQTTYDNEEEYTWAFIRATELR